MKSVQFLIICHFCLLFEPQAQEFRLQANSVHTNASYFSSIGLLGFNTTFGEAALQSWGWQVHGSYRTTDLLYTGIQWTRFAGIDDSESSITINHVAFSAMYDFKLLKDRFRIIPILAIGPQFFRVIDANGDETITSNFGQAKYGLNLEYRVVPKLYFSCGYMFNHNLWRAIRPSSGLNLELDVGKNLTAHEWSFGLSWYFEL